MRRGEFPALLALIFGLPFLGVGVCYVALLLVSAPLESMLIMVLFWVAGFLMFFKAKFSLIGQGKLISFGVSDMSQKNRICYILGYVLMGVGLIFSLGIIAFRF